MRGAISPLQQRSRTADGERSFAQLGHGGEETQGDFNGNIDVTVGGATTFQGGLGDNRDNYAQMGHGGRRADGTHTGNISLDSTGAINFLAGSGTTGVRGYAQLGHGGDQARNSTGYIGNITVESGGDINFIAGTPRSELLHARSRRCRLRWRPHR